MVKLNFKYIEWKERTNFLIYLHHQSIKLMKVSNGEKFYQIPFQFQKIVYCQKNVKEI
ncbi:hypothetical protein SAMN04488541_100166 [Thermoflexibacter ruber]|uniref:Uncharacterized protein n=1 Tax=Thermoflexibacter ruber TaxID=1003 RepID=A0A1I2A8A9_9BACT|nr:hypothetical protein SAMN04488541_100166 [Thermoflexibacter ruber]